MQNAKTATAFEQKTRTSMIEDPSGIAGTDAGK